MYNNEFQVFNEGNHNNNGDPHTQYYNKTTAGKYLTSTDTTGYHLLGNIKVPKLYFTYNTADKLELYYKLNVLGSIRENHAGSVNMNELLDETYNISIVFPTYYSPGNFVNITKQGNTEYGTLFLKDVSDSLFYAYEIYLYLPAYTAINVKLELNVNALNHYNTIYKDINYLTSCITLNDTLSLYSGDYTGIIKEKVTRKSFVIIPAVSGVDFTNKILKIASIRNLTNYKNVAFLRLLLFGYHAGYNGNSGGSYYENTLTVKVFAGTGISDGVVGASKVATLGTYKLYYYKDTTNNKVDLYIDAITNMSSYNNYNYISVSEIAKDYGDVRLALKTENALVDKTTLIGLTEI